MKELLIKHRFRLIFIPLGAIAGILYWKFVGCTSGTCPINSNWYTMMPYGMLFGWLIADFFKPDKKVEIEGEIKPE